MTQLSCGLQGLPAAFSCLQNVTCCLQLASASRPATFSWPPCLASWSPFASSVHTRPLTAPTLRTSVVRTAVVPPKAKFGQTQPTFGRFGRNQLECCCTQPEFGRLHLTWSSLRQAWLKGLAESSHDLAEPCYGKFIGPSPTLLEHDIEPNCNFVKFFRSSVEPEVDLVEPSPRVVECRPTWVPPTQWPNPDQFGRTQPQFDRIQARTPHDFSTTPDALDLVRRRMGLSFRARALLVVVVVDRWRMRALRAGQLVMRREASYLPTPSPTRRTGGGTQVWSAESPLM